MVGKKQNGSKMTVDKLARITAKGFLELEEKLDVKINNLRTELKGEMGELKSELRGEMGELRGEMGELRETVERSADKMLTAADKMAGQFNAWQEENAVGAAQLGLHQKLIDNHEHRIKKLEKLKV